MRSQKVRNAESMSHGKVAKKRYKTVDHLGECATFGQGWMTGHQKRRPVAKKHAYSNACHTLERMAKSNAAGICHAMRAITAASQQKIGFPRARLKRWPNRRIGSQERNPTEALRTNRCGKACINDRNGAPSRIKGGATAINRTWSTMWMERSSW